MMEELSFPSSSGATVVTPSGPSTTTSEEQHPTTQQQQQHFASPHQQLQNQQQENSFFGAMPHQYFQQPYPQHFNHQMHHYPSRFGMHHQHPFGMHSSSPRGQFSPRARVGDWMCPNGCGLVFSSKTNCFRCGVLKPPGSEIMASSLQEHNGSNGGFKGNEQHIGINGGAYGNRQYGGETSSNSGSSGFGNNNGLGNDNNIGGGRQYSNGQASHYHNGGYTAVNNGMLHHHHRNAPRAGDWLCPNGCGNVYASKTQCFRCGVHKPEQAKVLSEADVPNNRRGNGFRHSSGFGFFNGNSQEFPTIATAAAQQTSSHQQHNQTGTNGGEGEDKGGEGANEGAEDNSTNT